MQRLLAKLHSEDVTVFLLTSTIRFCLLTGFAQLKLIKAEFKNQGWGWGQCIEPRGFRDGQGGFLCFDCCFTSVLVVITGSDILSSLVLCGILWWCLVFRGVGMLSITLTGAAVLRSRTGMDFTGTDSPVSPVPAPGTSQIPQMGAL